jgi:hypothetical protein
MSTSGELTRAFVRLAKVELLQTKPDLMVQKTYVIDSERLSKKKSFCAYKGTL